MSFFKVSRSRVSIKTKIKMETNWDFIAVVPNLFVNWANIGDKKSWRANFGVKLNIKRGIFYKNYILKRSCGHSKIPRRAKICPRALGWAVLLYRIDFVEICRDVIFQSVEKVSTVETLDRDTIETNWDLHP